MALFATVANLCTLVTQNIGWESNPESPRNAEEAAQLQISRSSTAATLSLAIDGINVLVFIDLPLCVSESHGQRRVQ